MSVQSLFAEAKAAGVRLYLDGGKVKLSGNAEAMKALRPKLAPHKAEILAYLQSDEHRAGEFWPWAPYIGAADVQRMRTELVGMIERLSDMEGWPPEYRDDVLTRAVRGPLADLLPNLHHFNQRLTEAHAAAAAREAVEKRIWRFDR
ncbi:TubC N-terminal docking domain-related protein [Paraburkholderia atlantica]|uniref:TubC N-terminal docking domain-related protein n=1 Tax=Paraburkholderia atlantica TaxID=2654982 RepID=UPI0016080748|nr:hypothetical protein [Paraburkholderia atlantica]MBB5506709.1 hypothetical protein [Paraburkholderia atlantica]